MQSVRAYSHETAFGACMDSASPSKSAKEKGLPVSFFNQQRRATHLLHHAAVSEQHVRIGPLECKCAHAGDVICLAVSIWTCSKFSLRQLIFLVMLSAYYDKDLLPMEFTASNSFDA
eukprot:1149387-Pelagomonas_calceolata.AAC.5